MAIDLLLTGLTIGMIGKVLLGVAVISVHWRIVKEQRIDKVVLTEMRKERNLALLGIVLIVTGYLFEITSFGYIPYSECGFITPIECEELRMSEHESK